MTMTFDHVTGLCINLTDKPFSEIDFSVSTKPEIYAYEIFDVLTENGVSPEVAHQTAMTYSIQTQKAIRPTVATRTPYLHFNRTLH